MHAFICMTMQKITQAGHYACGLCRQSGRRSYASIYKARHNKKEDIKNEDKENRAHKKYLYHGVSHHLGLDVHDLGTKTEPLKAGMLLTVEPGIYIEEEQIGVRIENNVWITKKWQ